MPRTKLSHLSRTRKKILILFLMSLSSCVLSGLIWHSYLPTDNRQMSKLIEWKHEVDDGILTKINLAKDVPDKNKIVILMWTKFYQVEGDKLMRVMLTGRKWNKSCCSGDVEVTVDRGQLERATAIVFHNWPENLAIKDLPKTRRPDQLWILFGKESPHKSLNLTPFNDLFNWTMTYRRDSDIWAPYGDILKLDEPIPESKLNISGVPLDSWISGKTDLLAGVISHCPTPSRREDYVKLLRSADLPVNIYGSCESISNKAVCPRSNSTCNHTAWWIDLGYKYKFYFAAENAICVDYITEKFWRTLDLGMVPVVYGGGNYTSEGPPNSFIDVMDFPSHKALVEHLLYLDKNNEEYKKYFKWRRKYQVRRGEGWQGWCDLCKAVRRYKRKLEENNSDPNNLSSLSQSYSDLERWWVYKPPHENSVRACARPNFI